MKEEIPVESREQTLSYGKFRLNTSVFRMILLVAIALALPVALMVMGVREFVAKSQKSRSFVENSEFRKALEKIANTNLPSPSLSNEYHRFVFSGTKEKMDERQSRIRKTVTSLGGVVLESSGEGVKTRRLLVLIPESQISTFESFELQDVKQPSEENTSQNNKRFYELVFEVQ